MNTMEYLAGYYPFADTTIEPIAEAANFQDHWSFKDLAGFYGVDEGHVRTNVDGKLVEYLHLHSNWSDNESVRVLFAPMGNGALHPSVVMRALRLYAADQPAHMFVAAGPAHVPNNANVLTRAERSQVRSGDLSPLATPMLRELGRLGLDTADIYGYSLGATVGQAALLEAPHYGIAIDRAVLAEPANTTDRSLWRLAHDFQSSGNKLATYMAASGSRPFNEAVTQSDDFRGFVLGMARLSNIAIARGLSHDTYATFQADAVRENPNLRITTAFGTHSEISNPNGLAGLWRSDSLGDGHQTHYLPLMGMHHAGSEDINLHAAIMLEGLSLATR